MNHISTTQPTYNNTSLANIVVGLSKASAIAALLQAGIILKAKGGDEGRYNTAIYLDNNEGIVALVIGLSLANIILFLYWKYRSTANAFAHSGPQTITPAGAVYWYFIPIAWFWKPYEAMMNLKNAYNATNADENNRLMKWWILFWSGIGVVVVFLMTVPDPVQTISQARSYVGFSIVSYGLDAAFLWVAAEVVKSIASAEAKALGQV